MVIKKVWMVRIVTIIVGIVMRMVQIFIRKDFFIQYLQTTSFAYMDCF